MTSKPPLKDRLIEWVSVVAFILSALWAVNAWSEGSIAEVAAAVFVTVSAISILSVFARNNR